MLEIDDVPNLALGGILVERPHGSRCPSYHCNYRASEWKGCTVALVSVNKITIQLHRARQGQRWPQLVLSAYAGD
jgi:hypothetical protein